MNFTELIIIVHILKNSTIVATYFKILFEYLQLIISNPYLKR